MKEFEKIINDALENKDQVNQNSDKNLKDTINQIIKNLGMKTCWLENEETFAKKDADKPYIDYKIKNLPSFLQEINILKAQ